MARRETSKNPAVMSSINIKAFNKRYREVAEKRGIEGRRLTFGNAEARSKRNAKKREGMKED